MNLKNFLLFIFYFLFFAFCQAQSPDNKRKKMIIVSYFSFVHQMSQYVEAKTKDNIDCLLISTNSTDNFNSIKAKIDSLYTNFNADFLLLVGDNEHIPAYKMGEGLSDIHYTFEDENKPNPRMCVGRFSVETAADLQTMIDRNLRRKPFSKHVIGIASAKESDLTHKKDYEQVRFMGQQLQSKGFIFSELFADGYSNKLTYDDVITVLKGGASWINYAGNGSYEGWNTTMFENQHIDYLPDDVELPIILSASCLGGHFANRTCFAEKWLRSTKNSNPIGAVAVIMSSSLTDWDATLSAMLLIAENMPKTHSNCRLGELYLRGYQYIIDSMQRPKDAYCWVLFGDPSLWVYSPTENNNLKQIPHTQSLIVYPNPVKNQLIIENGELRIENYSIYSVVGQKLMQAPLSPPSKGEISAENSPFEGGSGMSKITIDVSHLANGMYFLKVDNKVVKFVKE